MNSTPPVRIPSLDEAAAFSPQQVVDLVGELSRELAAAKHQLDWFKRQIFGQKSEKRMIEPNPAQMSLGELPIPETSPEAPGQKVAGHIRRSPQTDFARDKDESLLFFDEARVPVETIAVGNPEITGLSSEQYEVIGEKVSHRLAQRPGSYVILKYVRPVIKRHDTQAIVCPAAPVGVIEGSRADVSFIAGMLIDKFAYPLPFYRQHQRLTDAGITVTRPWLTQLGQQGIALLEPVYDAMLGSIRASRVKAMDDALVLGAIASRTRVCRASRSRPDAPDRASSRRRISGRSMANWMKSASPSSTAGGSNTSNRPWG